MPRLVTPGDCVALSEFIPVAPVPVGLLWVPGAVVTPLPPGPPLPPAPWATAAAMGVNAKAEANAKACALLIIFFASLRPAEIAGTRARTSGGGFGLDQTSGGMRATVWRTSAAAKSCRSHYLARKDRALEKD